MPIVGGLDIHRRQITFDYLDTVTGQVCRGQISPADREHLRAWLARFAGRGDVAFAVEGCAGWRYVTEELAAAGITAHLAEPADTAARRGRKRHAKTDKTDARHLRMLLAEGRLPECWIPPARILECRALLELYNDLRRERTAWAQRIHAVLFHQGAPVLGEGALRTEKGVAELRAAAAAHLSAAGQLQVATALEMIDALEAQLHIVRHQLLDAARHLAGAKVLAARLYGVGPVTALAITCWLAGAGRFSSSRQAVRFAGLDITVSSSDRKGPPGKLSRQGPPVLRWAAYEAGKAHARATAPRPRLLRRRQGPQEQQARRAAGGPQDHPPGQPHPGRARRRRVRPRLKPPVTAAAARHRAQARATAELTDGAATAASSLRPAASRRQPARATRTA
jgi:transposase